MSGPIALFLGALALRRQTSSPSTCLSPASCEGPKFPSLHVRSSDSSCRLPLCLSRLGSTRGEEEETAEESGESQYGSDFVFVGREGYRGVEDMIGVDYGLWKTGLSLISSNGRSEPLRVIETSSIPEETADKIVRIAKTYRVSTFVVGKPVQKRPDLKHFGELDFHTMLFRDFAAALRDAAEDELMLRVRGRPPSVFFFNENFSTAEAKRQMGRRGDAHLREDRRVDAKAACLILDHFINIRGVGAEVIQPGVPRMFPQHTKRAAQQIWSSLPEVARLGGDADAVSNYGVSVAEPIRTGERARRGLHSNAGGVGQRLGGESDSSPPKGRRSLLGWKGEDEPEEGGVLRPPEKITKIPSWL
uniref:YqgF/RNase H-like domain-containing protein n=1 Tax=Chromera velia CCMP2878 TaxID=1169474 RepID=A0A0G4F922_9ALVE|mmetsp:Transcript_8501/g.16588  ORF Transcript_8501/g.16588 Transcript_8501/m.16588 type:complete len:361 (+) Transcript_8501:324-1406(+)|eukprot:Cvel_15653.t1-p1 / transcript=Cvel_15653.t1 / gene=Cvel_15653 / organism=Chromera_velia_CCMP2878 / gene_product=hypothetical protein / transcript_product=hypothetical protein / location=Cvel_scaffold1168:17370-20517(-) / protein_length=360 / sequence_SO=supercontig / SO=protein_coding / is_pseudo=false